MFSTPPFTPFISNDLSPFIQRAMMGANYISEEDAKFAEKVLSEKQMQHIINSVMQLMKEQEITPSKVIDPSKVSKPISMIQTLILHNIPRDIHEDDLRFFEKYGPVRDIYIPRNRDEDSHFYGTIKGFALIKFLKATDAQSAYDAEFGRLYIGGKLISIEFAREDFPKRNG